MLDGDYITVEAAAGVLRLTTRQVNRYGASGRVRTKRLGKRVLYHREDVDTLAEELDSINRIPAAPAPLARADLVPAGEMLEYLRDRDAQLLQLQGELARLSTENGALRARLEDVTSERDRIRGMLEDAEGQQRRPWWKRLLG